MNKGNLNKLVTNYPVELTEEEIANLSGTLAPVIAACGGGGGGTGGKIYTGIGFVNVNNTTNQIGLTNEANTKLNQDIPTKVSDLSDSANYQTVAGMDQYLTEGEAQATYLTKSSADTLYAPLSTTADIEALKEVSGDFSQYYTKNETYSKNEVYTKEDVYQKTETSSKSELANAFLGIVTNSELENAIGDVNQRIYDLADTVAGKQDSLTFGKDGTGAISSINSTALAGQGGTTYSAGQYINIDSNDTISVTGVMALDEYAQYEPVLIGDSNITATSSKVDSHTQWNLRINATPVTTDTTLKGENVVTAHTTNVSGEWAVGLVQSAYEAIDSVGGIATDVGTLKTASANWNKVSDKLDTTAFSTVSSNFLTAHQNLDNYYTKNETSSNTEITNALNVKLDSTAAAQIYQTISDMTNYLTTSDAATTYQPKGNYLVADDIKGKLDKSIYANASGNWEASYNVLTSYSAAGTWLTAHQNLDNYYTKTQVDNTFASATQLNDYLTTAQYHTDSGTFALKSDLNGLVNSASVTTNDNYVMTNTGWKVLTLPGGGMTKVYHDTTLTGDGNANDNQLGVKWETLSSNTIAYSNSAFNLTNGTSVSSFDQISAAIDSRYSKTASDGRYLQKSLDNTLTGDGTNNKKLGVAWSALSGNTIASAEKAGETQGFRWGDNTYQDTSAALTNLWNAKNHVTLQTANNILTVDNNDNTSATLSAMSYVNNTLNNRAFLPQKACVCLESEITTMATLANGQGMLFFVVSAH